MEFRSLQFILFTLATIIVFGNPLYAQKWNGQILEANTMKVLQDLGMANINSHDKATARFVTEKIEANFLEAGLDSMHIDSSSRMRNYLVHLGPRYQMDQIMYDSSAISIMDDLKIRIPASAKAFRIAREQIRDYMVRQGFPFAKIKLEGFIAEDSLVTGILHIDQGKQIFIDSLVIAGDVKIRQGYLENYLGLHAGEPYNHFRLLNAKDKLDKLSFVSLAQDPELTFIYDYARIDLQLKKEKSSRFDFIFGIIPTNAIEGQQLFLSLDLTAEMLNKMGYGEYLYIDFERLRPEQQRFEMQFNYPYLLDLPFALDLDFNFFRNSLDYQTLFSDIGFQYILGSRDYLKASWNFESTRLVDVDTTTIKSTQALPQDLDVNYNAIAFEAFFDKLDYRFNPRSGHRLRFRAAAGSRTVLRNTSILALSNDDFDYNTLYDSLDFARSRYELSTQLSLFRPIGVRGAFGMHVQAGWKYSSAELKRNEKFQIGGNKLLRGFDEASIFTDYYFIGTLEYRLLLSNNSYFSLPFVDVGLIEGANDKSEFVAGIGGSLGFETSVGLFNFSIAVGRRGDQGFDFSRPKAHFGFVSLF